MATEKEQENTAQQQELVVQTPHDALFKHVFSQVPNMASLVRSVLPAALVSRVDWDSLEQQPASVVDKALVGRHADLLFKVALDGREAYLYLLFEHLSTSDPLTPLRMLGYQVRIWEWWLDNHPGADRLPAIIPVVVHHSDSGWRAATEFSEIIDLDPDTLAVVGAYLPKFRLLLDDLSHQDESAIEARRLTAAAKVTVVFLQRLRSSEDPLGEIDRWWAAMVELAAASHGRDALVAFARYILSVTELMPSQVRKVFQRLGPVGDEAFMTGAQQLTKEVAERARVEGRAELLLRQLTVRFAPLPEQAVERVRQASADELDEFAERVLSAATLDDVLR